MCVKLEAYVGYWEPKSRTYARAESGAECMSYIHTHTRLMALCPGLPGWAGTRKVKPIWILQKQETVSGSGISWAICKSAPRSRLITTPAPHHSVFYRPDALPAAQPTVCMSVKEKFEGTLLSGCSAQQVSAFRARSFAYLMDTSAGRGGARSE